MSCVLPLCAAGSRAAARACAQRPRRAHAVLVLIGRKLEIAAAATASNFPAHKAAAQWRVTPILPSGITIDSDAANGNIITGNAIDSGGAAGAHRAAPLDYELLHARTVY